MEKRANIRSCHLHIRNQLFTVKWYTGYCLTSCTVCEWEYCDFLVLLFYIVNWLPGMVNEDYRSTFYLYILSIIHLYIKSLRTIKNIPESKVPFCTSKNVQKHWFLMHLALTTFYILQWHLQYPSTSLNL